MSVTSARGFRAAGVAAGIKAGGQLDLALVVSESGPVPSAAVFTRSMTAAAPVSLSRSHLADGRSAAVVLNSGCANAGTGERGAAAARAMAEAVGRAIGHAAEDVVVCSTGPIGPQLPDDLPKRVPELVAALSPDGHPAAEAILTTDSVPKQVTEFGDGWVVGGMAKGAGMIRPDMATMLAVLTTDARVDAATLHDVLGQAVGPTFNSLNIDGCQSTNDTVVIMSSGASAVEPDRDELTAAVTGVCRRLATAMAEDAEGASRVVTLTITGAETDDAARRLGMAVADSVLVRSSFYGGDPNWGRIYGALGVAGVPIDPAAVTVHYQGVQVASSGSSVGYDEPSLLSSMKSGPLDVRISVGHGQGKGVVVTTDLTPSYVVFNGEPS